MSAFSDYRDKLRATLAASDLAVGLRGLGVSSAMVEKVAGNKALRAARSLMKVPSVENSRGKGPRNV